MSQPTGGGATTTEIDMCVGNMLVLLQLELGDSEQPMPGALDSLGQLISHISSRPSFSYPIFTNYIVNADILEEIMHLATKQDSPVAFEIAPPSSTQLTRFVRTYLPFLKSFQSIVLSILLSFSVVKEEYLQEE